MNDFAQSSFLDRTLRGAWRAIAGVARGKTSGEVSPDLPDADLPTIRQQINDCLGARGGEVSARARTANLGRNYLSLNRDGRKRFLAVLAREVTLAPEPIAEAIEALTQATDLDSRQGAQRTLRVALRSPRFTLYKQFTALPQGVKFLVDLRAEILEFRKEDKAFDVLEGELKSLLLSWFDFGFLELTRIEWDSPASVLEKLIEYEAVHPINGWDDLKNRLGSDRRCFGFFHPRMPNEPLIFVMVALVNGISDNVQALLDTEAPVLDAEFADTAIFYSISNAQKGLEGISFGDFLIKRVVDELAREFKGLTQFATLSPVPGFRQWLKHTLAEAEAETEFLTGSERKKLGERSSGSGDADTLKYLLNQPAWHQSPEAAQALEGPLTRLCARFLTCAKPSSGLSLDPVAHFHLSNGARIERLNWLADTSENGINRSAGLMVNYVYKHAEIELNHEAYSGEGKIKMSSSVRSLTRGK